MSPSASSDVVSAAFQLIEDCAHVEERYILELLGAVSGTKSVVRLHLDSMAEYAALEAFASRTGLTCAHASTRNKLTWSNAIGDSFFSAVDWNDPEGTSFAAYVGRDYAVLEAAVQIEAGGTAFDAGRLLGYPHCCCLAYARLESGEYWVTSLAAASPLASYPHWGNKYAYLVHGASLFPDYFPCSLGCQGTHQLARVFADVGCMFGLDDLVARYDARMREPVLLGKGALRAGGRTYEWQIGGAGSLPDDALAAVAISQRVPLVDIPGGGYARILYFE